jgi:predicted ArsR family transcriptional regulator
LEQAKKQRAQRLEGGEGLAEWVGMKRATPLRLNALCVAKMIRYMQDVPCSVHDVAEVTGLSLQTSRRFVLALAREGAIHVVAWEHDGLGRFVTKVYAFGHGRNATKPKPFKSIAERRRDKRERVRQAATMQLMAGEIASCPTN